jgi:hypothetical protein
MGLFSDGSWADEFPVESLIDGVEGIGPPKTIRFRGMEFELVMRSPGSRAYVHHPEDGSEWSLIDADAPDMPVPGGPAVLRHAAPGSGNLLSEERLDPWQPDAD